MNIARSAGDFPTKSVNGSWRKFGAVLNPFRAQPQNMSVAGAFGRLEQTKRNKFGPEISRPVGIRLEYLPLIMR
jgi:hypothetical protein